MVQVSTHTDDSMIANCMKKKTEKQITGVIRSFLNLAFVRSSSTQVGKKYILTIAKATFDIIKKLLKYTLTKTEILGG